MRFQPHSGVPPSPPGSGEEPKDGGPTTNLHTLPCNLPGDVNEDGVIDDTDIDLLRDAINIGDPDDIFDVNARLAFEQLNFADARFATAPCFDNRLQHLQCVEVVRLQAAAMN